MNRSVILIAAFALTACATTEVVMGPPVSCRGDVACKYRWGRALAWVTQNAAYRVTQANDTIIQTAGPTQHAVTSAISVVRIPNPDGSETFQFQSGCDNFIGCRPSHGEMERDFRAFVMATAVPN